MSTVSAVDLVVVVGMVIFVGATLLFPERF
ncbi:K(+)-transporting ATPase subunit F [Nonomuraea rubra]